jgi:hypothetical protein
MSKAESRVRAAALLLFYIILSKLSLQKVNIFRTSITTNLRHSVLKGHAAAYTPQIRTTAVGITGDNKSKVVPSALMFIPSRRLGCYLEAERHPTYGGANMIS